jgi:hypothetical protein
MNILLPNKETLRLKILYKNKNHNFDLYFIIKMMVNKRIKIFAVLSLIVVSSNFSFI